MEESDDLLFMLSLENNENAYLELYKRHLIIIKKIIKKYSYALKECSIDHVDARLECEYFYFKALRTYSIFSKVSLDTYVYSCIEKGLISYIRFNSRFLNEQSVSFEDEKELYNIYVSDEILTLDKMANNDLIEEIKGKLSKNEKRVFEQLIIGLDYEEISLKNNISKKQLYNNIMRIKNKTKIVMDLYKIA